MWFRFPHGTTSASFHQQSFGIEHEAEVVEPDKDGKDVTKRYGFFRAPEHFAPTILALAGFRQVAQPEGAPDDLLAGDPGAAATVTAVTAQLTALQDENESLRRQLAEAAEMLKDYQQKLTAANARVAELEAASGNGDGKKK